MSGNVYLYIHIHLYIYHLMRVMFHYIENCFIIIIINSCEKIGKPFNTELKRKKEKKKGKKKRKEGYGRIGEYLQGETSTFLFKKFSKVKPSL